MAFNWTQVALTNIDPSFNPESMEGEALIAVSTLCIAGLIAVALGSWARVQMGSGDSAVIPAGRFSVRGVFEVMTEAVTSFARQVIGPDGGYYVPMFASVFFFVLLNNFLGMIPGMTPATENLNTTLPFGIFIFVAYNYMGIREHGFVAYFKHFMGPIIWLAPLMFLVELISHIVRPISLGLRLANVLMGDHKVLSMFLDMVPFIVPIPFYIMGLFVCVLQAFVFTLLSMVYVALATAHEH